MKKKHDGLITIILIVIVLTASFLYAKLTSESISKGLRISRLKPLPEVDVPGPAVLDDIRQLEKKMAGLLYPPALKEQDADLALFGFSHPTTFISSNAYRKKSLVAQIIINYSASFAFSSGEKSYCIIDGSFYTNGSSLPGGGEVIKIEPKKILVKKQNIEKWLIIPDKPSKIEDKKSIKRGKRKKRSKGP